MKLVAEPSLVLSLKVISPDGRSASALGAMSWWEGGSLLWTGPCCWAGLTAGTREYTLGSEQGSLSAGTLPSTQLPSLRECDPMGR